jgi:hypothetical protein
MEVIGGTVYWTFMNIDFENDFDTLAVAQAFYNSMSFADNVTSVELAVRYLEVE